MKNNFRIILAQKRLKISDVHKKTKISKSTLTSFYYENSKPKIETLLKLCDFLEITLNDLIITDENKITKFY